MWENVSKNVSIKEEYGPRPFQVDLVDNGYSTKEKCLVIRVMSIPLFEGWQYFEVGERGKLCPMLSPFHIHTL